MMMTITTSLVIPNLIQTVHRQGPYGNTTLHVSRNSKPFVQFVFTDSALQSLMDVSYENQPDADSKLNEIRRLYEQNAALFSSEEENLESSYVDCSTDIEILLQKHRDFLEQIDVYKTYNNRHPLITKLIIEIIDYYLNEYLVHQENFSHEQLEQTHRCFQQAIVEQNYLKYFIEAYTFTNHFHHILNKHLAVYILDYFNCPSSSSMKNYRLINCLVHIVTLIIHHPDRHLYRFKGVTYRGMRMRRVDLEKYPIGNAILNRTFVSTSKVRSIAQCFAGNSSSNDEVSVMFKYTIKRNRTAINVEYFSSIRDEREVLILPFSVFKVVDRLDNDPQMSPPVLFEIDLEECEEDMNERRILRNIPHRTKSGKRYSYLRFLWILLALLLTLPGIYLFKGTTKSNPDEPIWKNSSFFLSNNLNICPVFLDHCPSINNRSVWNAQQAKNVTLLRTPVRYVAILHTASQQCQTFDLCLLKIRTWQNEHMQEKGWTDIGYNFLIGADGEVFQGRGWQYVGSHCRDFNNKSIGMQSIV